MAGIYQRHEEHSYDAANHNTHKKTDHIDYSFQRGLRGAEPLTSCPPEDFVRTGTLLVTT